MTDLILPEEIREQVKKLVELRDEEIIWMLAEAMACKPLADWANINVEEFRENKTMHDTKIWFYLGVPFMTCATWMDRVKQQLMFKLERIKDNGPKIIT